MTDYTKVILDIMRPATAPADVFTLEDAKKYVTEFVTELARDYGIDDKPNTLKFHGQWTSHAGAVFGSSWRMTFGAESLEYFFSNGPLEYARLKKMLQTRGLFEARGYNGIRILILHEFAHVIQYFTNKNTYTYKDSYDDYYGPSSKAYKSIKPHGIEFKNAYSELLDKYTEVR